MSREVEAGVETDTYSKGVGMVVGGGELCRLLFEEGS